MAWPCESASDQNWSCARANGWPVGPPARCRTRVGERPAADAEGCVARRSSCTIGAKTKSASPRTRGGNAQPNTLAAWRAPCGQRRRPAVGSSPGRWRPRIRGNGRPGRCASTGGQASGGIELTVLQKQDCVRGLGSTLRCKPDNPEFSGWIGWNVKACRHAPPANVSGKRFALGDANVSQTLVGSVSPWLSDNRPSWITLANFVPRTVLRWRVAIRGSQKPYDDCHNWHRKKHRP
jgi:hypothetical protein